MKIKYSYVTGSRPEDNPMVTGGVYKVTGEGEILSVLENIAVNSRCITINGESISWVKDIYFEVIEE